MPIPIDPNDGAPSEAEEAVGRDDPGSDWKLSPLTHAAALPRRAARLKAVLLDPKIQTLMTEYEAFDHEAGRNQSRFRSRRRTLSWLAYVAVGSGLLAVAAYAFLGYVSDAQLALAGIHAVAVILVALLAWRIDVNDLRGAWKRARGQAEWRRIAIFAGVTDPTAGAEAAADGDLIDLAPLQLAYFRRYQLDVQLRYFEGRGRQLRRVVGLSRGMTWIAVAVSLLGFVLALLLAAGVAAEQGAPVPLWTLALMRPELGEVARWALLLFAITIIYGLLMTRTEPSEDARNAERYHALYRNLRFLKDHGYDTVRTAAVAGDPEKMRLFVHLVHELLQSEISEWLSLEDLASKEAKPEFAAAAVQGLSKILASERS